MKELVSIIIPFYNEERYIRDCLESLINQTYKNIEIICVDDGSTDNSVSFVREMQQSDRRISLLQQENLNAGVARNKGFSIAKGQYVLFLDSDDFFSPTMVECMLSKAIHTNSDIVFCTGYGMNDKTKVTYKMPVVGKENPTFPNKDVFSASDVVNGIFQLSVTWAWDKMYKSDFVKKKDLCFQNTKVCNDLAFVCLSYLYSERISCVNQHLICHRTNIDSSLYSAGEQNWMCLFEALSYLEKILISENIFSKHKISFLNLAAENIVYYLILRFTDYSRFNSFYEFYKHELSSHYRFMEQPKEKYRDGFVYSVIQSLETDSKGSFLLKCIHRLNSNNSKILGIANSKEWLLPYDLINNKQQVIICGKDDISYSFYEQIKHCNTNCRCSHIESEIKCLSHDMIEHLSDISAIIDLVIITDQDYSTYYKWHNYFISLGVKKSNIIWINTLYSDNWLSNYIVK